MPSDCVANYASTASDNYAQDNSGVSVSAWLDLSLVLLSHLGSLTISDTVAHLSLVLLSHLGSLTISDTVAHLIRHVSRCAWSEHCQVICNTVARPCEKKQSLAVHS